MRRSAFVAALLALVAGPGRAALSAGILNGAGRSAAPSAPIPAVLGIAPLSPIVPAVPVLSPLAELAALNESYVAEHGEAVTAAEFQGRLGRRFDALAEAASEEPAGPSDEAIEETLRFAREVRALAGSFETLTGKRPTVVPFLGDAESVYVALRALEGRDVDGFVRLAYVNRLALKTDAEKLKPGPGWGDRVAYNDWLRDSEVYSRLSHERPVSVVSSPDDRSFPAGEGMTVMHQGRAVGTIEDARGALVFKQTGDVGREALEEQGLAVLRDGKPVGMLVKPAGGGVVLQEGLMLESRIAARLKVAGGYDAPTRQDWPRAQEAFLEDFTRSIGRILSQEPDSIFSRQVIRLYDALALGDRDALFVDSGLKGTIPALFAAIHRLRTARRGEIYLYAVGRGYQEAVPALRPGGDHRVIEHTAKFGTMGGFGADGLSLVAASPAEQQAAASRQAMLLARRARNP